MTQGVVAERTFYEFLNRRATRLGFNNTTLADAAGIPTASLTEFLKGSRKKTSVEILAKLAGPLGIPFEELCRRAVGQTEVTPPPVDTQESVRREIMALLDEMDDRQLEKALRLIQDYAV